MPDRFPRLEVNPDPGLILHRRIRDQPDFVPITQPFHKPITPRKYGSVHGRPKSRWLALGKGR